MGAIRQYKEDNDIGEEQKEFGSIEDIKYVRHLFTPYRYRVGNRRRDRNLNKNHLPLLNKELIHYNRGIFL